MQPTTVGAVNRCWLALLGLLMLAAGLIGIGCWTGQFVHPDFGGRVGELLPSADAPVLGRVRPEAWLTARGDVLLIGVLSALIALGGLTWLLAQLPRVRRTPRYRLHDDARRGTISCEAKVIGAAAGERIRQLAEVSDADVEVGGTAGHPIVRVEVELDSRAEVPVVTAAVMERVFGDFGVALESPIDELAMTVTVGQPKSSARQVVVDPVPT